MNNIIYAFIVAFIFFGLYVELNPQMTNIWWRIDSNGEKQIVIYNLFALMLAPFKYMFYWYPNAWDINFFIWWIVIYIIFIIDDKVFYKVEKYYNNNLIKLPH
jgi:hypothetical protein